MEIPKALRKALAAIARMPGVRPFLDCQGPGIAIAGAPYPCLFRLVDPGLSQFELTIPWDYDVEKINFERAEGRAVDENEARELYQEILLRELSMAFAGTGYHLGETIREPSSSLFIFTGPAEACHPHVIGKIIGKLRREVRAQRVNSAVTPARQARNAPYQKRHSVRADRE